MDSRQTKYVAGLLLGLLLLSIAGNGIQWQEKKELNSEIRSLEKNISLLTTRLGALKQEKTELKQEKTELKQEKTELNQSLSLLSAKSTTYLQETDKSCSPASKDHMAIVNCFEELVKKQAEGPEIGFRLFNSEDNVLVLRNEGSSTLDGSEFRLVQAGETVDPNGCVKSEINPEGLCVLDFDQDWLSCQVGSRLVATYEGKDVYSRTCLS